MILFTFWSQFLITSINGNVSCIYMGGFLDFQEAFDKVPHEDRVDMWDEIVTVAYLAFHKGEGQIFSDHNLVIHKEGPNYVFQFFSRYGQNWIFGQDSIPLNTPLDRGLNWELVMSRRRQKVAINGGGGRHPIGEELRVKSLIDLGPTYRWNLQHF